jgi:hypothetical protein
MGRMRVVREHEFDLGVEEAFAFITDLANWPRYWPGLVRVEPGSKWNAPEDEARIVIRLLGRDVELRMTLRTIEVNRLVEYESRQRGLPDARHERHFSATDSGFRYRLVVEYEPRSGLRGLYDRLLVRRGVERAMGQTVTNLEAQFAQQKSLR